jgi:hypothetical protein
MEEMAKPAPCILIIGCQAKGKKRDMDQAQERIEAR